MSLGPDTSAVAFVSKVNKNCSRVHFKESSPQNLNPSDPSSFYASQSLAQYGQILGQLHHGNDSGSSNQSAGWPEEGVKDCHLAIDLRQDGTVRSVRWVHETLHGLLRPESLRDVLD